MDQFMAIRTSSIVGPAFRNHIAKIDSATCPDIPSLELGCEAVAIDTNSFFGNQSGTAHIEDLYMAVLDANEENEAFYRKLCRLDSICLKTRSIPKFVEAYTEALLHIFDLEAAAIIIQDTHPSAEIYQNIEVAGLGFIDPSEYSSLPKRIEFLENFQSEHLHIFNCNLFEICTAVVIPLYIDSAFLGLLCLGSKDPDRYRQGMNTEYLEILGLKTTYGFLNSWNQEESVRSALQTSIENVYSEAFFMEYFKKEFSRAWRGQTGFSLAAVSWTPQDPQYDNKLVQCIATHVRVSDMLAEAELAGLWLLLPGTGISGAEIAAKRLCEVIKREFEGKIDLRFGLTEFSRDAVAVSIMMHSALAALEKASERTQPICVETIHS